MYAAVRLLIAGAYLPLVAPVLAQQAVQPAGGVVPAPLAVPAADGASATWDAGTPALGVLPPGALPQTGLPQVSANPATAPAAGPAPLQAAEPTTWQEAPSKAPGAVEPATSPTPRPRAAAPDDGRTQHLLFERLPIHVLLAPGEERLVQFPFVAMMDVPPSLEGLLDVQIIEGTAYLTANGPFARSRVPVQAIDGTAKIPLDIEAVEGVAVAPVLEVHLPSEGGAEMTGSAAPQDARPIDVIVLTRFAAQTLYAPSRLVPVLAGVRQEPVGRKPVPGLYRGGDVETAPIGAWSSGPLHLTAVRFTNRSGWPLELDMEQLRGRWIAATPQHWRLLPRGSEADTTAVYLVSDRPFAAVPLFR